MAIVLRSPFWQVWKVPYEMFPDPESLHKVSVRLVKNYCGVHYTPKAESECLLFSLVSSKEYYEFVNGLLSKLKKLVICYEGFKLLLFLTTLYITYLGLESAIMFNVLESVLYILMSGILLAFMRCSGYIYLSLLSRTELNYNSKFSSENSSQLLSSHLKTGAKCFWVEIYSTSLPFSMVLS